MVSTAGVRFDEAHQGLRPEPNRSADFHDFDSPPLDQIVHRPQTYCEAGGGFYAIIEQG
jgi:hypothetical protein